MYVSSWNGVLYADTETLCWLLRKRSLLGKRFLYSNGTYLIHGLITEALNSSTPHLGIYVCGGFAGVYGFVGEVVSVVHMRMSSAEVISGTTRCQFQLVQIRVLLEHKGKNDYLSCPTVHSMHNTYQYIAEYIVSNILVHRVQVCTYLWPLISVFVHSLA